MKRGKKIISVIAVMIMVLGLCFGLISINPIISSAAGNCIVRVKLDSLGRVSTVSLRINGSYTLPNGTYLDPGSYTVYQTGGKVALRTSSGSNVYTSDSGYIKLTKRDTQDSGIKIGNYEYLGDFVFAKNGSYINVINHVDMETYLIGVVPYEIGENYNINALKAQAVCARSYSYDRLSGSTSITSYDIGDTSSDQVYRGYNSSYTNCIQAVMETAGQVLTYNGSVISTLYSASNGGMTSSNYYRWGSSRLPYFQVKIDEYDLEASFESSSYNTKFNLPKVGSSTELNNYVYKTMLPELLIQLYEQGYSADEDNFEILGFDNLTLHTPRFSDENCIMYLYLQADVILNAFKGAQGASPEPSDSADQYMQVSNTGYSGRCSLYEGPGSQYSVLASPREGSYVQILSKSGNYYEVLAANGDRGYISSSYLSNSGYTEETAIAQDAAQEQITLTLNIPMEGLKYTATCAGGFSFSAMNNKLIPHVREQSNYWQLSINGNGHGVGLSQIGARARAEAGQTYQEILAFYFDNTQVTTLDYEILGPGSNPDLDPNKWYGVVTLTDHSSNLNVRTAPSASAGKLGKLRHGAYVELVQKLDSGWYQIVFNGTTGYVSADYITELEKPSATSSASATAPTEPEIWTGVVTLKYSDSRLYVRETPSSSGAPLDSLYHGDEVELLSEHDGWFRIRYYKNGEERTGYVSASYIVAGPKPGDDTPSTPTATVYPSPSAGDTPLYIGTVTGTDQLRIREEANADAETLATALPGETLTILDSSNEEWYLVQNASGIQGYCSANYLKINRLFTYEPVQGTMVLGTVIDMDLNVRAEPSSTSLLLTTISLGSNVRVLAIADNGWYYIQLPDGSRGYVSYRYLRIETAADPSATAGATSSAEPDNTASASATAPAPTTPAATTPEATTPPVTTPPATTPPATTPPATTPPVTTPPATTPPVTTPPATTPPATTPPVTTPPVTTPPVTTPPVTTPPATTPPATTPAVTTPAITTPPATTPAATPTPTPPEPVEQIGLVQLENSTSRLNVRSAPSGSASIIGKLNHGANVTVIGESGDWYQIESGSVKGYVSKEYITIISYAQERIGTVTGASSLKVRSGPGTSYSRITAISGGTTVTVLGETNGWYFVRLANGTTGYCSAEYMTVSDSPAVPDDPDGRTGTVTGTDTLNVRSGPSTNNGILFTISRGTKVTVLEESNGWYKIQVLNRTGYAYAQYIEIDQTGASPSADNSKPASTPTSTPSPSQSAPPSSNETGRVTLENSTSRLNVRSAPNGSASIIGKLNHGAAVTITGESGDWYQIESGSIKGYVSKDYITVDGSVPQERTGTVTGASSLRVRSGPGTSYSRVTAISEGTKITILDETNGWYFVRLANGTTGYCSKEYITVSGDSGNSGGEEYGTGIVDVSSSLNVRSGPSTSSSVVASLSDGARVTILSRESNGWYRIRTSSGVTGYVSGEYINLTDEDDSDSPSQSYTGTVKLSSSTSRLNIRSSANKGASIIGKAANGSKVTIIGESGDWYRIEYNNTTGYVSKDYIQI